MSKKRDKKPVEAPEPVNVVDGIPDRSTHSGTWAYLIVAAVFVAWVAFLVYCQLAGQAAP